MAIVQGVGANTDIGAYDLRAATITADGLTSGRVVIAGTDGVLSEDSDLTFSGSTLTASDITFGGTLTANGDFDLGAATVDVTLNNATDALNFDSNTLSIDAASDRVGIGNAANAIVEHEPNIFQGEDTHGKNEGIKLFLHYISRLMI